MADTVSMEQVKKLRDMTGAGMMDCKKAIEATGGDIEKGIVWLRERGIAKAASRAGRATSNGAVEAYLHTTSPDYPAQVGVLVEVNCESDFVAKGDDFRKLAKELAMHIAAAAPRWLDREDVPAEEVERERAIYLKEAQESGRPEQAWEKILEGKLNDFYKTNCLLDQGWVREPKTPIRDLIAEHVSRLQENITVRRFSRFSIKEG